jgi:hypothetical protein
MTTRNLAVVFVPTLLRHLSDEALALSSALDKSFPCFSVHCHRSRGQRAPEFEFATEMARRNIVLVPGPTPLSKITARQRNSYLGSRRFPVGRTLDGDKRPSPAPPPSNLLLLARRGLHFILRDASLLPRPVVALISSFGMLLPPALRGLDCIPRDASLLPPALRGLDFIVRDASPTGPSWPRLHPSGCFPSSTDPLWSGSSPRTTLTTTTTISIRTAATVTAAVIPTR